MPRVKLISSHCCTACDVWHSCATKCTREEQGEAQICCPSCRQFSQCNPDFPQYQSANFSEKLIAIIGYCVSTKQFISARHLASFLPVEVFSTPTLARIYTDAFDKNMDRQILNEGYQLFQNLFDSVDDKANILLNLAFFEDYINSDTADQAMLLALEKDIPLTSVVKFYRWLRSDRKKVREQLKRFSTVSQKANSDILQTLCSDLETVNILRKKDKDYESLLQAVECLENFISQYRKYIDVTELGKLIAISLNNIMDNLTALGKKHSKSDKRETAIKCYEGVANGLKLFAEIWPNDVMSLLQLIIILDKLLEIRRAINHNWVNETEIISEIKIYTQKAVKMTLPLDKLGYFVCLNFLTLFHLVGEINDREATDEALKCAEKEGECLTRIVESFDPARATAHTIIDLQRLVLERSVLSRKLGLHNRLIEYFDQLLNTNPEWYEGYLAKCDVLMELDKNDEAEQCYKKCIDLRYDYVPAYHKLKHFYRKTGRYKEAVRIWVKYMRLPVIKEGKASLDWGFIELAHLWQDAGNDKIAANLFNYIITKRQPESQEPFHRLANIYMRSFEWEKAVSILESLVDISNDFNKSYNYFRWGVCLSHMGEYAEAICKLDNSLTYGPIPKYRFNSLILLRGLYLKINDIKNCELITDTLLDNEEVLVWLNTDHGISKNDLHVFFDSQEMSDYIARITKRLLKGDHWAVIEELQVLIKLNFIIKGQDDVVLLTKLAEAYRRAGHYELALETLSHVGKLDRRPKNQAYTLAYVGQTYMASCRYHEAIEAFQEAYELNRDIRMLLLKATAYRKLKEYDLSLRIYEQIISSGKDKKPYITKKGLAITYWDKYQAKGDKEAASLSLSTIIEILNENPNDWLTSALLAKAAKDEAALTLIESIIREGPTVTVINLLDALIKENSFHEKLLQACLAQLNTKEKGDKDYWKLVQTSADFLMRATIYSYFFMEDAALNKTLHVILEGIIRHPEANVILREYLCAEKGAYVDFFEHIYAKQIKEILEPLTKTGTQEPTIKNTLLSVKRFIQSEIPFNLRVLYKGHETVGVNLSDMLEKRFYEYRQINDGVTDIRRHPEGIPPNLHTSNPVWYMVEKLTDWWLPLYSGGEWSGADGSINLFDCSSKVIVDLVIQESENIIISFTASLICIDADSERFDAAFQVVYNLHQNCPMPKLPWFNFELHNEMVNKNQAKLSLSIYIPSCLSLTEPYEQLEPFVTHMMRSDVNSRHQSLSCC